MTHVRHSNIRGSEPHFVATAGGPPASSQSHGGRGGPPLPKKQLEWPPNGLERGAPRGRTPIFPRALPDHERYRPHPAGHLAGRRAVRHARPLARLGHGVAPVLQAAVALRGVPGRRRRGPVARPRPLGVARRQRHVSRRLDERAPHVRVARAGDPAARLGLAVNVNLSFTDSTNVISPIAPMHPHRFRQRQAPFPAPRSGARPFVR